MDVLENIFEKLVIEKCGNLNAAMFSVQYMGKNKSYLSYLRSSRKQPSADALVNLFNTLYIERQRHEGHTGEFYKDLTNEAFHLLRSSHKSSL